ncbi:hypothetical protein K32_47230 [Kaistia sp. 32K]|uniref:hypothetical protein n=1 Tax=Kaistia sp. 32K TaxID=2795690 RepID=UPI0019151FED|nr:hypothetical protein [Kaistia sp. 32K]BCP56106.1 hypothetical protein K32_47230 [Kaistia sp. 32K]
MAAAKGASPLSVTANLQAAMSAGDATQDHHGNVVVAATCSPDESCAPQALDPGATCCATSCHIAVSTILGAHDLSLAAGRLINTRVADQDVDDAFLRRLERPPRVADV